MYKKIVFLIFGLVLSDKLCGGQVLQFGTCTDVQTMQYFDLERFLGEWYEIERYPTWYEKYGECAYMRLQYCGRTVEIENIYVRDGIRFIIQRNSSYAPGDEATFFIEENNIDPVGIPMSVITTDYSNYAVVYGCKNNDALDIKYSAAWILSRNPRLPAETLQLARETLNSIPFANPIFLEKVEQRQALCHYHWTAHIEAEKLREETRQQLISEVDILAFTDLKRIRSRK